MKKSLIAGIPIVGFTGVNGAGKTALAVDCAISDMLAGRPVYSTVPIRYVDPSTGEVYESAPVVSLRQLLTLRDCTVLLDDVAVIFSSRSTNSLPPAVVAFLDTLRHRNITVIWTAPSWMRCDNLLRGVTQAVVNVMPVRLPLTSSETPWPSPWLVMAGVLDTHSGKLDAMPTKVLRRRVYRLRGLTSIGAYDTMADTPMLGAARYGGRCECGGMHPTPKHTQERHELLGLPWYDDEVLESQITPQPAAPYVRARVELAHPAPDSSPHHAVGHPQPDGEHHGESDYGADDDSDARRRELLDGHGPNVSDRLGVAAGESSPVVFR